MTTKVRPCPRCGTEGGSVGPKGARPIRCDSTRFGGPAGTCKTCHNTWSKAHAAGKVPGPVRGGKDVSPGGDVSRRLAGLAARGCSLRTAADAVGVAVNTAYVVAARDGFAFEGARGGRPHRFDADPAKADEFRRLAALGWTAARIAAAVGISPTTAYDVAGRLGVAIRGRVPAPQALPPSPPEPPPDPTSDARAAARRYLDARSAVLAARCPASFAWAEAGRRGAEAELVRLLNRKAMPVAVVEVGHVFGLDAAGELWVRPHRRHAAKSAERGPRVYRSMPSGGIR